MSDADIHESVSDALRAFSVEMEQYIHAGAGAAAIHRTDLTALTHAVLAAQAGATLTPGELASRMSLSPSATTSMLDRLEAAGHVVRSRDSADRRVVTVRVTDRAEDTGYRIFVPLARALETVMTGYTPAELAVVLRFLEDAAAAVRDARPQQHRPPPGTE